MTYVPAKYNEIDKAAHKHAFDVTDTKGRAVGAIRFCHTLVITRDPRTDRNGIVAQEADLGVWYCYSIQSTRDGNPFGASAKTSKFRNEIERDRKSEKALGRSRKLAIKKHTK